MSAETFADCPRDDCEGKVLVTLEYEPPDNNYGADADGNRGTYVGGYWIAFGSGACSLGHTLSGDEEAAIEQDAVDNAPNQYEDEYYGPDGPDDDY